MSSDDEVEVQQRPKRSRISQVDAPAAVMDMNSAHRGEVLFGSRRELADLSRVLDTYTREQWADLANNLLQTHLDNNTPEDQLINALHLMYNFHCHPYKNLSEVISRIETMYPDVHTLEQNNKRIIAVFGMIHVQLLSRKMLDEEEPNGVKLHGMIKAIAVNMKLNFDQMVLGRLSLHGNDEMLKAKLQDLTPDVIFRDTDPLKLKKHELVLRHYWKRAFVLGYRKSGDDLYKPVYNNKGQFVHAYKLECTITDFVFESIFPIDQNEALISCLIENPRTPKTCIELLTKLKSEYLPKLERNPNIFAFQNGLFVIDQNRFYRFNKEQDKPWVGDLQGNVTACIYHDQIFDEDGMEEDMQNAVDQGRLPSKHYMGISMDDIYKFLTYQGYTGDEIRWILCFLGRLLFQVGDRDKWGIFIYFIGLAGTGKGSLLRLVMMLLPREDVAILNNELQKTFALDGTEDARLLLGLDVNDAFKLDMATLLSMSVGEEVSVIQKFKRPVTVMWKSHCGFAGNTFPRWEDRGGNLTRRFFLVEFSKPVKNVDTGLFDRALKMKDRFLKVIVSAYLEITTMVGNRGVKEFVPDKFKQFEEKAMQELNVLLQFVSEYCEIEELEDEQQDRVYIQPFAEFNKAFAAYCRTRNMQKKQLTHNYMSGVFGRFQVLCVDPKVNDKYGQTQKYLLGLRLKTSALASLE